ncbi:MAG: SpoIIE family protein phosphatase [SAR324 cluster bacterium]|nr:SpoIIE family protein phosphatase [SAR324 cluster bacterium]
MNENVINVLLISDDEVQYMIVDKMFRKAPLTQYHLERVGTFQEAINHIKNNRHDVYLVDDHLENEKGISIIRDAGKNGCSAPMILVTSNTSLGSDIEAMEAGAFDYLIKSEISASLLERSLRYAIQHKRVESLLAKQNETISQHVRQAEKTNHYLIELTQRITQELEQARKTQMAILPQSIPSLPGCQIAAKYKPMEQIGGDFYDIFEFKRNKTGILLADVTGHGIPAALISFMVSSLFKSIAPKKQDIKNTIAQINNSLRKGLPQDTFATVFYCIYNSKSKVLNYISMGHPPGYLIRPRTQQILPLQSPGVLLGAFPILIENLKPKSVQLMPGDKVLLYTDGLTEMFSKSEKIFGKVQLESFLLKQKDLAIEELIESAYLHVLKYAETADFSDDVTLVGLELSEEKGEIPKNQKQKLFECAHE